ncbi:hypothetical protein ACB092_03G090100 [Castanea dentata]
MSTGNLSPINHVMSMILLANLYLVGDPSDLSLGQIHFLYGLIQGVPIYLGWHIYNVLWSMAEEGVQIHYVPFTSLISRFYKYKYVPLPETYHSIPLPKPISFNTLNGMYQEARNARTEDNPFSALPAYTSTFHSMNMQILFVDLSQQMTTSFGLVHDHMDHISSRLNRIENRLSPLPSPPRRTSEQ